jgi:hypothetical protein
MESWSPRVVVNVLKAGPVLLGEEFVGDPLLLPILIVLWHGSSITYLGYSLYCTSLKMWGLTLASCGRERGPG